MKTIGKLLAIIGMALFFLSLGLYITLNNLGFMLTEEHAGFKFRKVSSGIEIQTGNWTQRFTMKVPAQIHLSRGKWQFKNGKRKIILDAMPVIKIKWM